MTMKMKKIKITECDENVISKIPSIMKFLEDLFGEQEIRVYATLENNKLGFVGEASNFSVFIDSDAKYTIFTVGDDGKLASVYKDEYSIFFENNELSHIIDNNKVEYSVSFCPLLELDNDGYDGNVCFKQYNPTNDVLCSIYYQHMCRVKDDELYIYGEHTKHIAELYIDEEYNSKPRYGTGVLPKRAKYFIGYTFTDRDPEFKIAAIKDFGAIKVAKEGVISLLGSYKITRYFKAKATLPNGELFNTWPLGKQYVEDDLLNLIKGYDLKGELPQLFIDLYNDEDEDVTRIKQIIMDINKVKEDENPKTTNMWLKLKVLDK